MSRPQPAEQGIEIAAQAAEALDKAHTPRYAGKHSSPIDTSARRKSAGGPMFPAFFSHAALLDRL